jgi:hypothetical protein
MAPLSVDERRSFLEFVMIAMTGNPASRENIASVDREGKLHEEGKPCGSDLALTLLS